MPEAIPLPAPSDVLSDVNLLTRRSIRHFSGAPIAIEALGTILHAAQGIRHGDGKRLVPSAGSSYPLRIRVAVQNGPPLAAGIYIYTSDTHALQRVETGVSSRPDLAGAAFDAPWLDQASAALLISADFERTIRPFADQPPAGRAERYVWLEAGHAAQNVALAAAAFSLGTVLVGGFHDDLMRKAFHLPEEERPIALLPLGHPA